MLTSDPARGAARLSLLGMTGSGYLTAEARARVEIDRQLEACGWVVQDRSAMNLYAAQGVAVREFIMATGHGRADYNVQWLTSNRVDPAARVW
jgi:hypothetical protein